MQAFEGTQVARHRAKLLMVGDGPLRQECQAIAEANRLPVVFTGFLNQSEIASAYAASDCLILPSDHGETWGLVVNEAMAVGRPAIVSDLVGCASDLVTSGLTGEVFAFGEWPELTRTLDHYSTKPEQLMSMGHAARERVIGYSPSIAAEGIRNGIQWALKHGSSKIPRTASARS